MQRHALSSIMLSLRDSEEQAPPPAPAPPRELKREEQVAQACKQLSYKLYTEIMALSEQADGDDEVVAPRADVVRWLKELRELNVQIGQYARMSVARADRLSIEMVLCQTAMANDLLDREATHTHTLEAIAGLQLSDGGAAVGSGGADAYVSNSVAVTRAVRLVNSLNGGTSPFTTPEHVCYFDAGVAVAANRSV